MVRVKARGGDMGRQHIQAGRTQELKLILRAMCGGVCDGSGFGFFVHVFVLFGLGRRGRDVV